MENRFWKRGQRAEIAYKVKIGQNHLSEILYRKRGVDKVRAILLERASGEVLGYPIPWYEWLFNGVSKHPAFFKEPKENMYYQEGK